MPPAQPRKPDPVSATQKERNEYIPSYISKKPFYVTEDLTASDSTSADYLEHQRLQQQKSDQDAKWYNRGKKLGPAATKFRKGACENCGAMSHKTKDCLSRPRKQGARWTGRDIQADEAVEDLGGRGWDAKRDRWNGYDATEYNRVVEEYNELEELKRQMKGVTTQGEGEDGEEGDADGVKYEEETDMGRQQSTSTRNLRLREDTAKYLLNLDLDSAKYDPKTRSMVDSGATIDNVSELVAEEGFVKKSGDAGEFERAQKYAWETQERGDKNKLHLQANPTSGEFYRKKELQEKDAKREAQNKALLEKYGGQDHVQSTLLKDAAIVESERYVEYDETGHVKGAPKTKAKSQYPEDVFINNHTSVWGSWWADFKWGYACCHSTVKNSYCTGEDGKQAYAQSSLLRMGADIDEVPKENSWKKVVAREEHVPNAVERDDKAKLDEKSRKRTLEDMKGAVTEEDMEEYRRKRTVASDPMASFLGKDELVH